jgi:hypothetical protein
MLLLMIAASSLSMSLAIMNDEAAFSITLSSSTSRATNTFL